MEASSSRRRVSRFALVGIAATAIYAAGAFLLSGGFGPAMLPAAAASVAAYVVAGLFSYGGHKYFTFVSGGNHLFEAPRFIVLTAVGLGISALLPVILVDGLLLPPLVPIIATCVAVPVVNYVVLDRWVFASRPAFPDHGPAS